MGYTRTSLVEVDGTCHQPVHRSAEADLRLSRSIVLPTACSLICALAMIGQLACSQDTLKATVISD